MSVSDEQSYSAIIRDVLFMATATLPFFEGFTARRTRQLPSQAYHLPYLGVYFVNDHAVSDGDWNAGSLDWMVDTKIGFSVQMEDNDPVQLELSLDQAFWEILNGVFRDPFVMNMISTYNPRTGTQNPDNTRIEGVPRFDRRINWGSTGPKNEMPWAELQFEPVLRHRYMLWPVIDDDFLRLHKTIALMKDGKVSGEEIQRVIERIELPGQKETTP